MPIDLHDHLARESARFAEAIQQAAPSARVPSCPDWTADDLLWHLTEVQFFWLTVVKEKLDRAGAEKRKPPRPADRAGLLDLYRRASRELGVTLALSSPDTPAWTWSSDHTVGFVLRRQAHEALIHRVDAELTAGSRTPIDAGLADDGVAEALGVMYGHTPEWGSFTPDADRAVRFRADDTGGSWLVTLGRFTGTDPEGKSYDEPDIHLIGTDKDADASAAGGAGGGGAGGGGGAAAGGGGGAAAGGGGAGGGGGGAASAGIGAWPASAEIHGTAADLDCWLWHRPPVGPVERTGDPDVLSALDAAIAPGIS